MQKGPRTSRPGIVTVGAPAPHDGIANALRSTYAAGREAIPDDMMDLIEKLGKH